MGDDQAWHRREKSQKGIIMINEPHLIVCKSTNHMLRATRMIEGVYEYELVPVPAEYGSVCNTAIRIGNEHIPAVKDLLVEKKVAVEGIYPENRRKLPGLVSAVQSLDISRPVLRIMEKVEQGFDLNRDELITLLAASQDDMEAVFIAGNMMRKAVIGDVVDIRAVIEFSNYCVKNCCYCGVRRDNQHLARYRMLPEEIIDIAREMKSIGHHTIILQSGEDLWYTAERMLKIIHGIKEATNLRITLSIGERTREEYRMFREAGANNYLLKIETSNPIGFAEIHPDDDYAVRLEHSKWLKELGYITGSGNIVGLPNQTMRDLADDIILMKQTGIHMIGIGPFLPADHTPLANTSAGDYNLSLKTVAVARIHLKNVFIPSTTALATLAPDGLQRGLEVGANTIMYNLTPGQYRQNYAIYSDKAVIDLEKTIAAVRAAGRKVQGSLKI
jgi:biotin synthase